jgi:hypothetical protein
VVVVVAVVGTVAAGAGVGFVTGVGRLVDDGWVDDARVDDAGVDGVVVGGEVLGATTVGAVGPRAGAAADRTGAVVRDGARASVTRAVAARAAADGVTRGDATGDEVEAEKRAAPAARTVTVVSDPHELHRPYVTIPTVGPGPPRKKGGGTEVCQPSWTALTRSSATEATR